MNRIKIICICILILCFFSGCGKNNIENRTEPETMDLSSQTELVWVAPDLEDCSSNLEMFNQKLYRDGYKYKLKIVYLSSSDYYEELKDYLNENSADIICAGMNNGIDMTSTGLQLIHEGIFEPIDDMFADNPGRELYELFNETIWECNRIDDNIYIVPNSIIGECEEKYIAFNPECVSLDVLNEFDGSFSMLYELYNEYGKSDMKIYSYVQGEMSFPDYDLLGGCFISGNDATVYAANEFDVIKDEFFTQNKMYNEGIYEILDSETTPQYKDDYFAYIMNGNPYEADSDVVYEYGVIAENLFSMGYGISSQSKYKEDAFELLSLLYTNSDYANTLIYGEHYIEDGCLYLESGGTPKYSFKPLVMGCYLALDYNADNYSEVSKIESAARKFSLYKKSGISLYEIDLSAIKKELKNTYEICSKKDMVLITASDFENEWNTFAKELEEAGVYKIKDELVNRLNEHGY